MKELYPHLEPADSVMVTEMEGQWATTITTVKRMRIHKTTQVTSLPHCHLTVSQLSRLSVGPLTQVTSLPLATTSTVSHLEAGVPQPETVSP